MFKRFEKSGPVLKKWGKMGKNRQKWLSENPHLYTTDDKFKCDENGRKFSKWVKTTVGKGEIARYEQFLLFPQCFQKTYTAAT